MALGLILSWIASNWRTTVWLALVVRLVVFVAVIAVLARSFGTSAALVALIASVVTRGLLVKKSLDASR